MYCFTFFSILLNITIIFRWYPFSTTVIIIPPPMTSLRVISFNGTIFLNRRTPTISTNKNNFSLLQNTTNPNTPQHPPPTTPPTITPKNIKQKIPPKKKKKIIQTNPPPNPPPHKTSPIKSLSSAHHSPLTHIMGGNWVANPKPCRYSPTNSY